MILSYHLDGSAVHSHPGVFPKSLSTTSGDLVSNISTFQLSVCSTFVELALLFSNTCTFFCPFFCIHEKLNSLVFKRFRIPWQKHGDGVPPSHLEIKGSDALLTPEDFPPIAPIGPLLAVVAVHWFLMSSGRKHCVYLRLGFFRMRAYLRAIKPFEKVLFSSRVNSRCGKPLGNSGMPSPIRTGTTPT